MNPDCLHLDLTERSDAGVNKNTVTILCTICDTEAGLLLMLKMLV